MHFAAEIPVDVKETAGTEIPAAVAEETTTEEDAILTVAVAVQLIGSVPVSILGALEPVTGVVIGVFVFSELLTLKAVAGIVLILAAVFVLVSSPTKLFSHGKAMFRHIRLSRGR